VAAAGTVLPSLVGSKGGWTQIFASLNHDTYGLLIGLTMAASAANNRHHFVDIGVGAGGAEAVIIPDLAGCQTGLYDRTGIVWYWFPFFIPAGTRIAARAQGSTAASVVRVVMTAYQRPLNPAMIETVSRVERLGLTGIVGTTVTPGTTSEGTWTSIGTTTNACWHWQIGSQVAVADTTWADSVVHWDIAHGDGTNFNIIAEHIRHAKDTNERLTWSAWMTDCEAYVPAGSTIYVRGQALNATDVMAVIVYGAGG
jgi:hypothetical protein